MALATVLFAMWGFLWAGYFALDGFDFGVGMLFLLLGKSEAKRKVLINSIGPVWNGNEVWLIAAGSVTFAAFPAAYAGIFSSFYLLVALLIATIIFRGLAFDFRSKGERRWTRTWDAAFAVGSIIPAFLFGVIFGNIFRGLDMGPGGFSGSFLSLLNPYALLSGVLFLALFAYHGSAWLSLKTGGDLNRRAADAADVSLTFLVLSGAIFIVYTVFGTHMFDNYVNHPGWWTVPVLLIASLAASRYFLMKRYSAAAFLASGFAVVMTVFFAVVGLYPNLLPSNRSSTFSITISSAAASGYALWLMLGVLVIFMPLVIGYQLWVYGVFKSPLLEEVVMKDEDAY